MIYRRIDENGDYTFGQGKYNFVSSLDAVAQAIKTRLLLLYAEWWENLEDGVPLFEQILSQKMTLQNKNTIDLLIKERILSTDNVTGIYDYASDFNYLSNTYSVTTTVNTTYGTVTNLVIEMGV